MIPSCDSKRKDKASEDRPPSQISWANPEAINTLFYLHRARRINWRAFGLGVALSCFADRDTGRTWMSRGRMTQITGIQTRDISRVVRELEGADFFTVEHYVGRVNSYVLTRERTATSGKKPSTRGRKAVEPVGEKPPISISKNQDKQTGTPSTSSLAAKRELDKVAWSSESGFTIPDYVTESLAAAFPSVDISAEAARAHAWCCTNPDKAPNRDSGNFLFRWMARIKPDDTEGAGSDVPCGFVPPSPELFAALEQEFGHSSPEWFAELDQEFEQYCREEEYD